MQLLLTGSLGSGTPHKPEQDFLGATRRPEAPCFPLSSHRCPPCSVVLQAVPAHTCSLRMCFQGTSDTSNAIWVTAAWMVRTDTCHAILLMREWGSERLWHQDHKARE